MSISILYSILVLGGLGLFFGLLLAFASGIFKVEVDEKQAKISELLPGANCGGCGYPGCAALAEEIVKGNAPVDACPATKRETGLEIANIMGVNLDESVKKVAVIHCAGTCDKITRKYEYDGIRDCRASNKLGGDKECDAGCLGYGTCLSHCRFGAISIVNGIAAIDTEICVGCGACVTVCPKKLIDLIPRKNTQIVLCNNTDKGPTTRKYCSIGCIGCKICEKTCEFDAIKVENNLAVIDVEKCTNCGACAEKCPRKVISDMVI